MCSKQNRRCEPKRVQNDCRNKCITNFNERYIMRMYEENVIQISGGITINVSVRIKTVIYRKKIIFGIFLHAVVKMENI